jgi:hypothetical protein
MMKIQNLTSSPRTHSFMKSDGNSEPKFLHIQELGLAYGIDMNWLF